MTERTRRRARGAWIPLLAVAAVACSGPGDADSGAPKAGEVRRSNLPAALQDAPLQCDERWEGTVGAYRVENNTWGKQNITRFKQCVAIGEPPDGVGAITRWRWDWPREHDRVKAYPAIIYGQKPGTPTTEPALPMQVQDLKKLDVTWRVESHFTGMGNTSFDLWLQNDPKAPQFAVPPITHEIMIWLNRWGDMPAGGKFRERVRLDGAEYDLWVGENFAMGWTYIAFVAVRSQLHARHLDLMPFIDTLRSRNIVPGDTWFASIELGNEVVYGDGETTLLEYTIGMDPSSASPSPASPAADGPAADGPASNDPATGDASPQ